MWAVVKLQPGHVLKKLNLFFAQSNHNIYFCMCIFKFRQYAYIIKYVIYLKILRKIKKIMLQDFLQAAWAGFVHL